ncbi:MAG: RNA-binding S4 domain-containing protein [Litorilituus sp.]|nr:RNA-binding S4 domain-containing protein [Litorilituus sp.]
MSSYLEVQLAQQPIELCKLLKVADLVGGGGEAKVAISEGYVLLNGEVEFQKRKKVYHKDIVEFNGEIIQVIVDEDLAEQIAQSSQHLTSHHQRDEVPKIEEQRQSAKNNKTSPTKELKKRKPISF